jgi:hypothetical protein
MNGRTKTVGLSTTNLVRLQCARWDSAGPTDRRRRRKEKEMKKVKDEEEKEKEEKDIYIQFIQSWRDSLIIDMLLSAVCVLFVVSRVRKFRRDL